MEILKQKISNHKTLVVDGKPVERMVIINGVNLDFKYSQIAIDADIIYSNHEGESINGLPPQKIDNWYITNSKTTTVRDASGKPVPNPKYVKAPETGEDTREEEEKEEFIKMPSFSYFASIITNPKAPNLLDLLRSYILLDDADGFFG